MLPALPLAIALLGAPPSPAPAATAPSPAPAAPPPTRIELPEPRPVPRVTLTESRRIRPFYGKRKPAFFPGIRIGVGLGARLAGQRSDRAHFALDVLAFGRVGLHRGDQQAALFPAFGYSLGAGKVTREHLFVAGLGLGMLDVTYRKEAAIALVPAFVVGVAERERVLGVRTSLVVDFIREGPVLEVAHQYLHLPSGHRHELRLIFALDLRKLFD